MANTIELIREVEVGDHIEHHNKYGTYFYKILAISEEQDKPINYKVKFISNEEDEEW